MATNTGRKDALGRTVYQGPRGGKYILTASGKKGAPATGGRRMAPKRKPAAKAAAGKRKPAAAKRNSLPMPRSQPRTATEAYANAARVAKLSQQFKTEAGLLKVRKYRDHVQKHWHPSLAEFWEDAFLEKIPRGTEGMVFVRAKRPVVRENLPMPRRQPKTTKNAYDNGMRVGKLQFKTEAGIRKISKYQDHVYDRWNRDKAESFLQGFDGRYGPGWGKGTLY